MILLALFACTAEPVDTAAGDTGREKRSRSCRPPAR